MNFRIMDAGTSIAHNYHVVVHISSGKKSSADSDIG